MNGETLSSAEHAALPGSGASRHSERRQSFVGLRSRMRAQSLLDAATARELVDPFDMEAAPGCGLQDAVCQSDGGVVVLRGYMQSKPAVVVAIEPLFESSGIVEVSGTKIACALELALDASRRGMSMQVVLLLEAGGVRTWETELGLAVIAEIQSAIIALRTRVPVVCVIAGMAGCFGGMAITAALCSTIIMTRQGRLGMSTPGVIRQPANTREPESQARQLIWGMTGGGQRVATGMADVLVSDDVADIREAVDDAFARAHTRSHAQEIAQHLAQLQELDPEMVTPEVLRRTVRAWSTCESRRPGDMATRLPEGPRWPNSRGAVWTLALSDCVFGEAPVWCGRGVLANEAAAFVAVVPHPSGRFARAHDSVMGLEQGWRVAQAVTGIVREDEPLAVKRAIVAIVDVRSQACGHVEEIMGIHLACAAAVEAYTRARQAGHPVIALLVGAATSAAFLSHGFQANRIVALNSPGVTTQAIERKRPASRDARTPLSAEHDERAPVSRSRLNAFTRLGLLDALIDDVDADSPDGAQIARVRKVLLACVHSARGDGGSLASRLDSATAREARAASIRVRSLMKQQWGDDEYSP